MLEHLFTVHWCNFSSYSDQWLLNSFVELSAQLRSNYPELPVPRFSALSECLIAELPDYLISMLPGTAHDDRFEDYKRKCIFVLCDGDEEFARIYQEHNQLAHWGVAIPCSFAIAWEPNKFLVWHEALHLMNAKDCYNKFGIDKCPNPSCLMRRAPSHINCGDQLTLCSKNVKRIKQFGVELESLTEGWLQGPNSR